MRECQREVKREERREGRERGGGMRKERDDEYERLKEREGERGREVREMDKYRDKVEGETEK